MAMFREHVAFGAIISMIVVVALYFYALVTDPILLLFLFGVTVVGSFLPDVDSDSGMPFYIIYGTACLGATAIVLLYLLNSTYAADWRYLAGVPVAALLVLWFIVGGVVKRCTHHRGIFHSVPALAIAGVGSFLVARHYGLDEQVAWIFGGAMAAGYLSHLVLDELHSSITLDGIPFNPKVTEGTALKLFSRSTKVNVAAYVLLAVLAYTALQPLPVDAYYNDSDIIEIENDVPPELEVGPEDGNGSGGSGGTGGGSTITGGGSGGTGGSGASGSGNGSNNGNGSGDGGTDEDELLNALLESGALSGLSNGGNGSGAGSDFSSGSGILTVVGEKVRQALSRRSDLRDILQSWKNLRGKGAKGKSDARDLGLVAASTALSDENVQEISFSADAFAIQYRSRGYMLGLFPWRFPVHVNIVPQAPEGSRVTIKLPWYRFFVREFFTPEGLTNDIEGALKTALAADAGDGDERALLFDAVATLLREKVGTVGNSVLLGS